MEDKTSCDFHEADRRLKSGPLSVQLADVDLVVPAKFVLHFRKTTNDKKKGTSTDVTYRLEKDADTLRCEITRGEKSGGKQEEGGRPVRTGQSWL
jgi:hypothetical protein